MEYVLGPVLAVLISMKFTDFTSKRAAADNKKAMASYHAEVSSLIAENTSTVSKQTLKMMLPMADSVRKINDQLGL
tara:strand:+ start:128 stop:355 length:228 start_codon:yes stop_codon:yes gene_type:complete